MGLSHITCSDQPTVPHSLQYVRLVLPGLSGIGTVFHQDLKLVPVWLLHLRL